MKSPITKKPLHNPGESLDHKIMDIKFDMLVFPITTIVAIVMTLLEWYRLYVKIPPQPVTYTILALILLGISAWNIKKSLNRIKLLRLGRDGEKEVGQLLDCLRENGAKIFHDIPGDGFNLDHVVVHNTGVYVIETKTLSKPEKGETKLIFDGNRIIKNGLELDRNPIIQVQTGSKWLTELIEQSTGHKTKIKPVVVYPGWYIEQTTEAKKSDVWVLNPKALPAFIAHRQETMNPREFHMFSLHLDMYIRAKQMQN
jgi:hypothetical protein